MARNLLKDIGYKHYAELAQPTMRVFQECNYLKDTTPQRSSDYHIDYMDGSSLYVGDVYKIMESLYELGVEDYEKLTLEELKERYV